MSVATAEPLPKLVTLDQITTRLVPLGKRTLHRFISEGKFPPADVAIGNKVRLWRRESVERWIDNGGRLAD